MNDIGTICLPDGRSAALGWDYSWRSRDARLAAILNTSFDPLYELGSSLAGQPLGRRTVTQAARALGGTPQLPEVGDELLNDRLTPEEQQELEQLEQKMRRAEHTREEGRRIAELLRKRGTWEGKGIEAD